MASLREVKGRLASIKSTRKITSALQMISGAKLQQAQTALGNMLPYEERMHAMLRAFLYRARLQEHFSHPLLEERPVVHLAVVAVASDTGFCGAYNSRIIARLQEVLEAYPQVPRKNITIYAIGKKMVAAARQTGCQVSEQFVSLASHPNYTTCSSLSRKLGIQFLRGKLDKVEMLYYHFNSRASQQIERRCFLPFSPNNFPEGNPSYGREIESKEGTFIPAAYIESDLDANYGDYIIEPSAQGVMDLLLPKVLRFTVFRAMLDANASENAARSLSMRVATENADTLINELTVLYNKTRQMAITNELLDIMKE